VPLLTVQTWARPPGTFPLPYPPTSAITHTDSQIDRPGLVKRYLWLRSLSYAIGAWIDALAQMKKLHLATGNAREMHSSRSRRDRRYPRSSPKKWRRGSTGVDHVHLAEEGDQDLWQDDPCGLKVTYQELSEEVLV
jgi:hypothetical protein